MKQLPEYFVIERDEQNPLWSKYILWLNKEYSQDWEGNLYRFYGYHGSLGNNGTYGDDYLSSFENNTTLITLDQWNECVNGFTLPDKWCIIRKPENSESINRFFTQIYNGKKKFTANGVYFQNVYTDYLHYPAIKDKTIFHAVQSGYTLITYEQFQKYVLKTQPMVNYKVKGTPIPSLVGTHFKYRTTHEDFTFHIINDTSTLEYPNFISHGYDVINGVVLIRIENPDYEGDNFFLVRESDLLSITPKQTEMSKKIIGFKLTKPEYHQAVKEITGYQSFNFISHDDYITPPKDGAIGTACYESLKQAGVLDLWFEPVYESEEKVFNMGGFDLKVRGGKVFHKNEDITEYTKGLVQEFRRERVFGEPSRKAIIKDVIFSTTGCENNETKLSDWVKVYEALNTQKG